MSHDAPLTPPLPDDAGPLRPLWPTLARWWRPAAVAVEPELGYESAQPWTLGVDTPANDEGAAPY